jgi:inner membrane protein
MPTILTHSLAALALMPCFGRERVARRVIAIGVLCTIIPDLDVIGLKLGIAYDSPLGHRGLSHSLAFAAVLAAGFALLLRATGVRVSAWRVWLFLFLCTASHGILDALTNGGHGVAFFAPFSDERHFLAWRPVQVSPIGLRRFLSGEAWPVLLSELRWMMLPLGCLALAAWAYRSTGRDAADGRV